MVSRHQERFIDGTPWSLQTSFYPMSLVDRGALRLIQAQNIPEGTVEYLRDSLDIKQAGYRDVIIVRAPDETETAFFKLPDDGRVSVVATRRTAYDQEGQAFRLTLSVYPADRNQFVVKVGEVPPDPASDPAGPGRGRKRVSAAGDTRGRAAAAGRPIGHNRLPWAIMHAGHGTGHQPWRTRDSRARTSEIEMRKRGGVMAKRFGRPSLQYRYEHYDPR